MIICPCCTHPVEASMGLAACLRAPSRVFPDFSCCLGLEDDEFVLLEGAGPVPLVEAAAADIMHARRGERGGRSWWSSELVRDPTAQPEQTNA